MTYDEQEILQVSEYVWATYVEAGHPINSGSAVWVARFLVYRQSATAHAAAAQALGGLRAALGLGADPANPFPPDPAPPDPDPPIPPAPIIPVKATDRLHAYGSALYHEDDSLAFLLGVTAFPILDFFIREGPTRIEPYVDWAIGCLGYGCEFRGFGMGHGVIGSWTVDYLGANSHIVTTYSEQEYLYGLDALCTWLKPKGARLKLDLYADCKVRNDGTGGTMPNASTRRMFAPKVKEALQPHTNARATAGNEGPYNDYDPIADFPGPAGSLLTGRGSNGGDEEPPTPALDFFDLHPGRNWQETQGGRVYSDAWRRRFKWIWDVKHGNDGAPLIRRPGGADEPIGIGEVWEAGRTTTNPQACGEGAALSKLFGDFIIGHARCGLRDLVPGGPITTACLKAMKEYADLVPDDARLGTYTRGPNLNCSLEHDDALALRTFEMFSGNRGVLVVLDPLPDYSAPGRGDGWQARLKSWAQVESQSGPKGQIVRVTR